MKIPKMKKREEKKETVKITYYVYCPKCDREIKGTSQSMVEYNFKVHMERKHNAQPTKAGI